MIDLGVQMLLLVGPTVPLPAPFTLTDALRSVEVESKDDDHDGFQMEFALGRDRIVDYGLLSDGLLEPPSRVVIVMIFQGTPEVLIDGVVTDHQVTPTNVPGEARLRVSGYGVSIMMDLEEKNATYPNQGDSMIAMQLIGPYARYGIVPQITPTTNIPIETDQVPSQQGTDFAYLRELARQNNYLFYLEPGPIPGQSTAFFGPDLRASLPQLPLSMNMGSDTNVDDPLYFRYDALGPTEPIVTILEGNTATPVTIPVTPLAAVPLATRPATPLRKSIARDAARLSAAEGMLRSMTEAAAGSDAVTASGEMDAVRYGTILRARRNVGVRGVGESYGGIYRVKQVTHRIRRGEYKQAFTLVRDGRGTTTPVLPTL
jgi:hypothetical protein